MVVPKSSLSNWKLDFQNLCPSLSVIVLERTKNSLKDFLDDQIKEGNCNVLLTTNALIMKEKDILQTINWCYSIIDETKSMNDVAFSLILQFSSKYRLLLTNSNMDISLQKWLHFVMPSVFVSLGTIHNTRLTSTRMKEQRRLEKVSILYKL